MLTGGPSELFRPDLHSNMGFTHKRVEIRLPEGATHAYRYFVESRGIKGAGRGGISVTVRGESVRSSYEAPKPYSFVYEPERDELALLLLWHKNHTTTISRTAWVCTNGMGSHAHIREAILSAFKRYGYPKFPIKRTLTVSKAESTTLFDKIGSIW